MAGNRLNGALSDVGALGPPISAIGVDRHSIGDDHLRDGLEILDLVGPGPIAHSVHSGTARGHVRQVGADIAERLDLHAENAAVVVKRRLDQFRVRPAVTGRLVALRPRLPPFDWMPQLAGQIGAEQLFGVEVHLCPEAAADVRRDHPQQMLRNTYGFGDPAPMHVRHLTGQVDRQPAIDAGLGEDGAGLEASRNEPVVDKAQTQNLVGLASRRGVVAAADLEVRRDIVRNVFVELRSAVAGGGLLVDHGRQRLISNINELQCVVGLFTYPAANERDAFADETNPVDGYHRPVWYHRTRDDPVRLDIADLAGEVSTGENEAHASGGPGGRKV